MASLRTSWPGSNTERAVLCSSMDSSSSGRALRQRQPWLGWTQCLRPIPASTRRSSPAEREAVRPTTWSARGRTDDALRRSRGRAEAAPDPPRVYARRERVAAVSASAGRDATLVGARRPQPDAGEADAWVGRPAVRRLSAHDRPRAERLDALRKHRPRVPDRHRGLDAVAASGRSERRRRFAPGADGEGADDPRRVVMARAPAAHPYQAVVVAASVMPWDSSQRSASMAALQPSAAAVTACLYRWSWTSPAMKTPSIFEPVSSWTTR